MSERVYIETYGCQMNVADSEIMAGVLAGSGYIAVDSVDEADVVLLNTCAIREKAEDRILGRLGWLKSAKRARPSLLIGVAGCMAEHIKETLVQRAPHVDLVIGPDAYRRLPQLLAQARKATHDPQIDVRLDREELYTGIDPQHSAKLSGFITIMRGCDKFCTFCIVPYVRGRERSVPPQEILKQAQRMQQLGFREVTLLGQTVSSYAVNGTCFADLLRALHDATDLRIRFTSPYPTDFDDTLLETLAELPRVAKHLHLPVQSGSSKILHDMQRRYSAEEYLRLIEKVRKTLPDHAISTDIIVGYPGESEVDFEHTLELSRTVQFDSAFMFKYSERSGTVAAKKRPDTVSEACKQERLQRLLALQDQSSTARALQMIGKTVDVLISGVSRRDATQAVGRSSCFRPIILDTLLPAGSLVPALVNASTLRTLFASPIDQQHRQCAS